MQLDKHPIIKQCYDVMQAIEVCGASVELTHAVTLAGQLGEDIDKLVDQLHFQDKTEHLITIDQIKKLELKPTDILLLNCDTECVTQDQITKLHNHIQTINSNLIMVVLDLKSSLETIPSKEFYDLLKIIESKHNLSDETTKFIEENHD